MLPSLLLNFIELLGRGVTACLRSTDCDRLIADGVVDVETNGDGHRLLEAAKEDDDDIEEFEEDDGVGK